MARPTRCRRIERLPEYRSFSPDDVHAAESVRMTVDEFEALRLLVTRAHEKRPDGGALQDPPLYDWSLAFLRYPRNAQ